MRRTSLAIGIFLVSVALAPAASGQTLDWLADEAGFAISPNPGSPRLEAMGGLTVSVPDEGRELNLSDYGRNLAAVLWDSDGRLWEGWMRSSERVLDSYDADGMRERTRHQLLEAGGRVTWRGGSDQRIIGLDYALGRLESSIERGDGSKSSGPLWGGFLGRRFGRVSAAASVRFSSDNEDLSTSDVFAIRHEGSGIRYTGALTYQIPSVEIGLQAEHQVNVIDGISRDESRFHEDELTWKRPVRLYDVSVVLDPAEKIHGAVRGRLVRIDGGEEARISWSDRMPQNPGQQNFATRTGTFQEEVRGYDLGTRWDFTPLEGLQVSGEVKRSFLDTKIEEGSNFKGSLRAGDRERTATSLTAGASVSGMDGRLRVGGEGSLLRQVREETILGARTEVTSREVEARVGAEWFVSDVVALRGGFLRSAVDDDVDAGRTLRIGSGFTIGLGYLPRGGLIQLDAAVRVQDLDPDYGGDPHLDESRTSVQIGARLLL